MMRNDNPLPLGHLAAYLIFLLILPQPGTAAQKAAAQEAFVPVYHPELTIRRAPGEIRIDGELGDEGWNGAAKADNFSEHSPGDQTKPAVDTEVLVTYDDSNLYIAWICYDDPSQVRASFCERDRIFSDDYVILCLDMYGEATHAYEIAANPYGIPGDLLFSAAYGEDINYDMIFESMGRITDFGWVVEMKIPFRSLRFPDREEQVWRVDFWRNRPREVRYQYSWAAYDRDVACWPCQWGTVRGATGVKSGAGFEILPAVVAYKTGSMDDDGVFQNDEFDGEPSLGMKYNITSELAAELTLNPDFSQVESDAAQIDINTTFALFYPEKRPFFQEGSDLFNTYFNAVYTRSINDPSVAGKLTMRRGASSLAYMSARDENSIIILPFEEFSSFVANGKSYSNLLRYRYDLGEGAHLGLVMTDRRFDSGGSGSLGGIDGQIRFTESNSMVFQLLASHTEEINDPALTDSAFNENRFDGDKYTAALDGEKYMGHSFFVELERSTADYEVEAAYMELSPTFRADNGFEPRNNDRMFQVATGVIKRYEDGGVFENINGSMNLARKWNFDGVKKDEWVNLNLSLNFRAAQSGTHFAFLASDELFGGVQFNEIWQVHGCFSTQPWEQLRFGANYNYGHRIARHDLVMGKEVSYGVWADLRPISRLRIYPELSQISSDDLQTGERLFSQAIMRTRLDIQISRRFSFRLITQYNDRHSIWDLDPLLTYRVNSFSVFYVGSTHSYREMALDEYSAEEWRLTDRQYFLKFQYLFQL